MSRTAANIRNLFSFLDLQHLHDQPGCFGGGKKLTALEEDLIQTRNESGQDPINYQVKLDNQLAYLYSSISSQDSRPNCPLYDRYEELIIPLEKAAGVFKEITENELKGFIQLLEENDIPRIIIKKKK